MLRTRFLLPQTRRLVCTSHTRSLFNFGSKGTDVEAESKALHNEVLTPLNARLLGPLEKFSDQLTPMPLVFVLGNHSRHVYLVSRAS